MGVVKGVKFCLTETLNLKREKLSISRIDRHLALCLDLNVVSVLKNSQETTNEESPSRKSEIPEC